MLVIVVKIGTVVFGICCPEGKLIIDPFSILNVADNRLRKIYCTDKVDVKLFRENAIFVIVNGIVWPRGTVLFPSSHFLSLRKC